MTLIQQARALEARIEALEARAGSLDASGGVLAELRDLKGAAGRLATLEADRDRLPPLEEAVADLRNLGDPRPVLRDLAARLDALEVRVGAQSRTVEELAAKLDALVARRRVGPLQGFVWLLSTVAAGVLGWRSGLDPLMIAGACLAAAIGVGALLRAGN